MPLLVERDAKWRKYDKCNKELSPQDLDLLNMKVSRVLLYIIYYLYIILLYIYIIILLLYIYIILYYWRMVCSVLAVSDTTLVPITTSSAR